MKVIKYRGYRIVHFIGTNEWSVEDANHNHLHLCDTRADAKAYIDHRC